MEIDALQFFPPDGKNRPMQCSLKIESPSDVEILKKDKLPLAYVVKASCLDTFRKFPDIIEDKGVKHESVPLSRNMLCSLKIPIIDGVNYKLPGKLKQSVYQFLAKAVDEKDRNLYIIGAPDDPFNKLFQSVASRSRPKLNQQNVPSFGDNRAENDTFPDSIMRLMGDQPVSDNLAQKYLGKSKEAEFVRRLILLAAHNGTPVLIVGATGTGKEVVAREIHNYSGRPGRFVPVNCGAITETLFESELFGCKKGAHSTAFYKKTGLWMEADQGTLFLDEIGDLPLDMQTKILRAVHPTENQKQRIRPVGSEKEISVDARIIAATNRDVFSMVQSGTFREDLYYRLRDFFIPTPPLKDHPKDIPLMAKSFWEKDVPGNNKAPLSPEILAEFQEYRWPGNARELKAVLNQLNTLFPAKTNLTVDHLFAVFDLEGQSSGHKSEPGKKPGQEQPCSKFECRRHLGRVEDAIRAAERAASPLTKHRGKNDKVVSKVAGSLAYRLDELDLLCRYPLRFNDETTFVRVNALKSKLFYLHTLLASGEVEEALSNWGNSVQEEFAVTLSGVKGEIEAIRVGKRL